MPIRLYLTQNFGGYESGDPFALLGQLALNCTGATCVVVFEVVTASRRSMNVVIEPLCNGMCFQLHDTIRRSDAGNHHP